MLGFVALHSYSSISIVLRDAVVNLDQLHDVPVHALSIRDFLDKLVRVLWSCAGRSHQDAKQGVE